MGMDCWGDYSRNFDRSYCSCDRHNSKKEKQRGRTGVPKVLKMFFFVFFADRSVDKQSVI